LILDIRKLIEHFEFYSLFLPDFLILMQIVNHGVSSLKNMGNEVKRFFELPLQEKKRCAQKPGSLEGYGQAFVTSEEQKLDWNDMIFLKSLPIQNRKLDLWPQNPPQFRYIHYIVQ
jgi:isopenicillin N synthase-like dioxygenase